MSSPESETTEKPDGERWLELIGYGHLKGQPTGFVRDGKSVLAEEFDTLCGEWARPIFVGLESLDPNDPDYNAYIEVVREKFDSYFQVAQKVNE